MVTDLGEGSLGEHTGKEGQRSQVTNEQANSHEKTGLSAGTVADDDELATDVGSHLCDVVSS